MKTLQEYTEELREKDLYMLIDLLSITSDDIVDRFDDKIEDVYEEGEDVTPLYEDEEDDS